jgi:hypothetical protein
MKKSKGNKGLLDKKRFEPMEQEKKRWLRGLTMKQAIRIEEAIISSVVISKHRKNFPEDHPICLKLSLQRMRRAAQQRRRRAVLKSGANY